VNFIFRIVYRCYRLLSSVWYWFGRRFTLAGRTMIGAFFAAALIGVDTQNTVGYQAFVLLFFLLLVAVSFRWFFRARFSAERRLPRFGSVGEPLHYQVSIKNLTAKSQRGLTLLENLTDPRPTFEEWLDVQNADEKNGGSFRVKQHRRTNPFRRVALKESPMPAIPANQSVDVPVEIQPLRRGVLRFSGVTIARPDPLGLHRAFITVPLPQTVLILPKRYPLPPIALPGAKKYQAGGVALASNIGQSEEFMALRDYRPGDPLRHIHWRSWAKAGRPVVKEFEDEFFVRHALVLDTFTDQPHGDAFEEAVSVAASFACTLQTQESLLDLLFIGTEAYCFTSGRGLAHADQLLEILASVRGCPDRPFSTLEELVLNHSASVSGCICVLLAWDAERRNFVNKIKALDLPVLVLLVLAAGQHQPVDPGPMRDEPEHFLVLEAGQIGPVLARLAL
jgi:uncharacterized protein (DUF58 family)